MSPKSAGLAAKWGHKNLLVYVDGLPAWKKAGKHVVPSVDYVADGNIVLIDVRSTAEVEKGHIRGAVSIPYSTLVKMGDDGAKLLEKYKDKHLVFYCGGTT